MVYKRLLLVVNPATDKSASVAGAGIVCKE